MQITKKQHYVSKFYLKAWTFDGKKSLFCLMNDKIFPSNIENLAQERYFYEIREINFEEINFLKNVIYKNNNSELVKSYLDFINISNNSFKLIKISNLFEETDSEKVENIFKKDLKEHHENYFAELEDKVAPLFEKLIEGDKSFLNDSEQKKFFLLHISAQYFRTKSMKANLKKLEDIMKNTKYGNVSIENIFTHISVYFSINMASNINEMNSNIVFIKNLTDEDFITSDQPIINIWKAKNLEKEKIEEVELYIPIAPKLAVLISKTIPYDLEIFDVEEVKEKKKKIVNLSLEKIFANKKEQLEYYRIVRNSFNN